MLNQLYSQYFQKSKCFLFPLLGIRKTEHTASLTTYISWDNVYGIDQLKLIVLKKDGIDTMSYHSFEKIHLLSNKYFERLVYVDNNSIVYIFNLQQFEEDWKCFLAGKYSKFSYYSKHLIKKYFQIASDEWQYMESFLYPSKYWDTYAELLYDIRDRPAGLTLIKSVGELCNIYNPDMEQLTVVRKDILETQH